MNTTGDRSPSLVERLRRGNGDGSPAAVREGDELMDAAATEIELLQTEIEVWKDRWEADRRDHEAEVESLLAELKEVS